MKVILMVLPNKTSFRTIGSTLDRLEELFLTMKEAKGYMEVAKYKGPRGTWKLN